MTGLSTNQVKRELKYEPGFIGCFPSDKIPPIRKYPCTFVINTEKSGHPGDHWVAIYMTQTITFYFDSFGLPVIEEDIYNYLRRYCKSVIYNKKCIQDVTSDACGMFCIAFIKKVYSLNSFNLFVNNFNFDNLKENDIIVLKYV